MKYETTYRIIRERKSDSEITLRFLNPLTIEEDEKRFFVNLLKLRFTSTDTIILEDLEVQIDELMNENSIDRKYIGKEIEGLNVTIIYYCRIDLNYHSKIRNLKSKLNSTAEIIKLTDPMWLTAHKLLNSNE